MFRKVVQPFYTLYVALTFTVSILLALPVIAAMGLGNSVRARSAIHSFIRLWSKCWLWAIGMSVKVSGPAPPSGRYIVVANHISYLDTLVIFPAIPGHFRPLGKKEISKIPVIGFIYKQIVIMVNRSSAVSRSISMRLMWRVLKKEGNIVIFPEGTFNETEAPLKEFFDGAFRLAITTQTDILPLVLPDTVDRWHFSHWWKLWPGKNRAEFLKPISVQGMEMSQLKELKAKVYSDMENALVALKQQAKK